MFSYHKSVTNAPRRYFVERDGQPFCVVEMISTYRWRAENKWGAVWRATRRAAVERLDEITQAAKEAQR